MSAASPVFAEPRSVDAAPPIVKMEPGDGVTFDAGDRFSANLKTRFLLRYQLDFPPEQPGGRDLKQTVNVQTLRVSFSGHAYDPKLKYLIQLALAGRDYRDGTVSPVYDAFLDWRVHRDLSVRVGQYFVPFDRLRTVRESALELADRARPVAELTLDRDVGITLYSNTFLGDASPLALRLGVFGGGGPNLTTGKEPGALAVGRVELRPLGPIDDDADGDLERRPAPRLALGAGAARNWNTDRVRSTTGATFAGGTTDYDHAAVDLVFKWQGLALQAEHVWRVASVNTLTSLDDTGEPLTEHTRSGRGFIVQASYVFDPPIQFVGRYSQLHAASGTDPAFAREVDRFGREVAAGVNYYVNGHKLKLQADVISRMSEDFEIAAGQHAVHLQLDVTH